MLLPPTYTIKRFMVMFDCSPCLRNVQREDPKNEVDLRSFISVSFFGE